jgi:hypothetical protein
VDGTDLQAVLDDAAGATAMTRELPEALEKWLNSVPPGTCPGCKQPIFKRGQQRSRRQRVCTRKRCPGRQEYLRLYAAGVNLRLRGPSFLREVARVVSVEGKPHRVLVVLSPCQHILELPRSKGDTGQKKRQCQECRGGIPPQAAQAV